MRNKTILVLTYQLPASSETFVIDHIVGLYHKGWKVVVAGFNVDETAINKILKSRNISIDIVSLGHLVFSSRLKRLMLAIGYLGIGKTLFLPQARHAAQTAAAILPAIRKIKPDVIHAHFGPIGLIGAVTARKLGAHLIVNFHGYDVLVVPQKYGWDSYRRLFSGSTIVTHSTFIEEKTRINIPNANIKRITLGADKELFKGSTRTNKWPKPLKLLTVGRLEFNKGHHLALDALALLRWSHPEWNVHLRICGGGTLKDVLQKHAHLLNVADAVSFVGEISNIQVASEMADTDVLLIPSVRLSNGWQEAFCRVAVEGMAAGLAVIGNPTGGLPDTIGDGGIVIPSCTPRSLANAVENVVKKKTPNEMSQIAINRASTFTIDRMWNDYSNLLDQTLSATT